MEDVNTSSRERSASLSDEQLAAVNAAVQEALKNANPAANARTGASDEDTRAAKSIDLVGLMFFILEKFLFVLVLAALGAMFFGYRAGKSVPVYTATSKLFIVNPNSTKISMSDLQLGTYLAMDYQEVFRTWEVHQAVRERLELPFSNAALQGMITVSNPEDTHVLYISCTCPDAQMAADIANAYAEEASEFIVNSMRGERPTSFSEALVPAYAHVTSKSGAMIKGFLLGTVLSVGVLTLLFVMDNRPRTPEDIAEFGGIPTLCVLPSTKEMKRLQKNEAKYGKTRRKKS